MGADLDLDQREKLLLQRETELQLREQLLFEQAQAGLGSGAGIDASEFEAREAALREREEAVLQLQRELVELQTRTLDSESKLRQDLEREFGAQVQALQLEIAAARRGGDEAQRKSTAVQRDLEQRERALAKREHEARQREAAAADAASSAAAAEGERAVAERLAAGEKALGERLAAGEKALGERTKSVARREQEVSQRESALRKTMAAAASAEAERGQLQQLTEKHQAELAEKNAEIARLRARIAELERLLALQRQARVAAEEARDEAEARATAQIVDQSAAATALRAALDQRQERLLEQQRVWTNTMVEREITLSNKHSALNQEIRRLAMLREQESESLEKLVAKQAEARALGEQLQAAVGALESHLANKDALLREANRNLDEVEAAVQRLRAEADAKRAECERLESQIVQRDFALGAAGRGALGPMASFTSLASPTLGPLERGSVEFPGLPPPKALGGGKVVLPAPGGGPTARGSSQLPPLPASRGGAERRTGMALPLPEEGEAARGPAVPEPSTAAGDSVGRQEAAGVRSPGESPVPMGAAAAAAASAGAGPSDGEGKSRGGGAHQVLFVLDPGARPSPAKPFQAASRPGEESSHSASSQRTWWRTDDGELSDAGLSDWGTAMSKHSLSCNSTVLTQGSGDLSRVPFSDAVATTAHLLRGLRLSGQIGWQRLQRCHYAVSSLESKRGAVAGELAGLRRRALSLQAELEGAINEGTALTSSLAQVASTAQLVPIVRRLLQWQESQTLWQEGLLDLSNSLRALGRRN